jgi:hypothetical protein
MFSHNKLSYFCSYPSMYINLNEYKTKGKLDILSPNERRYLGMAFHLESTLIIRTGKSYVNSSRILVSLTMN